MNIGEFIINGVHSNDLHAKIQTRPIIEHPRRKNDIKDVYGVNGYLYFDGGAYNPVDVDVRLFIEANSFDEFHERKEALRHEFDHEGYVDFQYYVDETKVYRVHLEEMKSENNRAYRYINDVFLRLSVFPFKYDSNPEEFNGSTLTITNPYNYKSKPLITVEGTGDITLLVNDIPFILRGVNKPLIIDSQIEHVYSETNGVVYNENNKAYSLDFPLLKTGINTIKATGTVTNINVKPRWWTLI